MVLFYVITVFKVLLQSAGRSALRFGLSVFSDGITMPAKGKHYLNQTSALPFICALSKHAQVSAYMEDLIGIFSTGRPLGGRLTNTFLQGREPEL